MFWQLQEYFLSLNYSKDKKGLDRGIVLLKQVIQEDNRNLSARDYWPRKTKTKIFLSSLGSLNPALGLKIKVV